VRGHKELNEVLVLPDYRSHVVVDLSRVLLIVIQSCDLALDRTLKQLRPIFTGRSRGTARRNAVCAEDVEQRRIAEEVIHVGRIEGRLVGEL